MAHSSNDYTGWTGWARVGTFGTWQRVFAHESETVVRQHMEQHLAEHQGIGVEITVLTDGQDPNRRRVR